MDALSNLVSRFSNFLKGDGEEHPMSMQDTIKQILLDNTRDFGPSLITGGQLHKIDEATAEKEAELIAEYAPKNDLDPLLVVAGIIGESRGDPKAVNPNKQKSVADETAHQAFLHMDAGVAQFDVASIITTTEFLGLTDTQILNKMQTLEWAIPAYCKFVANLFEKSKEEYAKNPNLLGFIPHRDQSLLAEEAYNKGLHGAESEAMTGGPFSYAQSWEARYVYYKKMVGETT